MQNNLIFDNGSIQIDLLNSDKFRLYSIDGVSPTSTINSIAVAGYDGATYISEQTEKRAITITLGFRGETDHEVDKYTLYTLFRTKQEGVLRYIGNTRDLKIKCRPTAVNIPPNAFPFRAQVLLECDDPYFYADEIVSYMAQIIGKVHFPFELNGTFELGQIDNNLVAEIINNGEIPTGCVFTLRANGTVNNPKIFNLQTREFMQVNMSMATGDILTINTQLGQKGITLKRNNKVSNYINKKVYGSTFLQLEVGENLFAYSASSGINALEMTCAYTQKYGGV